MTITVKSKISQNMINKICNSCNSTEQVVLTYDSQRLLCMECIESTQDQPRDEDDYSNQCPDGECYYHNDDEICTCKDEEIINEVFNND